MTIKILSKSILDRPTLNISNDNIYSKIEYSKKNNKMEYVSIYSNSVKCTNNTSVNTSYTLSNKTDTNYENSITLYSGNISDYENFNDIKIENDSLKLLGVYNVYDSDNSTVRSDVKQFLFKTTIKKENANIDYSTISICYNINQNILQTGVYALDSLNRNTKNFLENQTIKEVIKEDKPYTIYFANNENDAISFLGNKNTGEFVFYPRLTTQYCSIVNRDDDFDIYFYQSFYVKRIKSYGYYIGDLLNLYLDFSFDIYAKEIVSTSNNINDNAKYSLSDNELLSTTTTIASEDIYTVINNSIAREFGKGKHSIDLTCLYMEYKDTDGNVVYNGKDGNTISIGDEIEPYYHTDNGDNPIGTYPNGDPLQFVVYSSELESNDGVYIKNHIKGIEKTQNQYLKVKVADDYTNSDKTNIYNLPINDEVIATYGNDIGDIIDGLIPDVDSQNIPARARTLSVEVNTTMELETNQNSFRKVVITDSGITQYRGKIMAFQIPENSNVTIGQFTFNSTNLYRVGVNINSETNVLPANVKLSSGCFKNTQLQNITIPETIVEIPSSCFRNCPLTSAVLGKKTGWHTGLSYTNDDLKNWIDMRNPSTSATYLKSTYANDILYWHSTVQGTMNSWKAGYILDTTVGSQLNYVSNGSWTSFNGTIYVPSGASTISWDTLNFINTYDSDGKLLRPQLWNAGTTHNLNSTDKLICGSILNANYTGDVKITFSFEE